ncbi:polyphosphate:AMP phosphotransferase [Methylocystis sp. 9N]|uniref:Polyphosphate:AMP phosphotransferase n=1 Tax=Methylocystis borbori TaxID=3118750 RepID=A0ABU7XE78_9HYPH
MFESARLPHAMTKEDFALFETKLRESLLNAQFELAEQKRAATVVLINGSDGAGKGEVVNRLYDWLDDHFVETLSYGPPTDEERARPGAWRYWRDVPPKGRIGLVLGSWHHRALRNRALGRLDRVAYGNTLEEMNRVEEMLRLEGVYLLKIWLYLDDREARRRLAGLRQADGAMRRPVVLEWEEIDTAKERARLNEAALEMIEMTSTGDAPWAVVPADDPHYRDAAVGDLLLQTLARASSTAQAIAARTLAVAAPDLALPRPSVASALDLTQKADPDAYGAELRALQRRLTAATTAKSFRDKGLVLVFEGNDAAGKGGAIRRVREALDPRRFRVHGVAAPTDEERARPYLWRFWRNIPRRGDVAIFDRSWYGRVLVERVEGFASRDDWMRAYQEINDFERQLHEAGYIVVKLWLAISQDEQLRRFEDREAKPFKRYKLTPDDWRNREKWALYEQATTDMVDRTSSRHAPWTLIEANDKKFARLKVLRAIVERLEK